MALDRTKPLPRLRQLEIIPTSQQGRLLFVLRDPLGISSRALTVSAEAFFAISQLDGRNSYADIQVAFMRQFGRMLFSEDMESLLEKLDECLFLDNERFRDAVRAIEDEFSRSSVRQPSNAGLSYPPEPDALKRLLGEILAAEPMPSFRGKPAGLIAPHIDLARGRSGYSVAYQAIGDIEPKTFVVLGTNHRGSSRRVFALTHKDFLTPLGLARTDKDAVDFIAGKLGGDAFANEIDHRAEHSVELQLLFLQHLFGAEVRIVPILTSPPELPDGRLPLDPMTDEDYRKLVESLRELIALRGDDLFVIAAADLAHIGPQFGAPQPLDEAQLASSRGRDLRMLELLGTDDRGAFFEYVASEQNARNVCGLASIDILNRLLSDSRAVLLHYDQWYDNNGMASVSYASVVFCRTDE